MLAKPRLHGAASVAARRRHCFKALLFGRRHEAWAGCSFYAGEHRLALGWVPTRCRAADDDPRLGAGALCGERISGLGGRSPSTARRGGHRAGGRCTGGRCTGGRSTGDRSTAGRCTGGRSTGGRSQGLPAECGRSSAAAACRSAAADGCALARRRAAVQQLVAGRRRRRLGQQRVACPGRGRRRRLGHHRIADGCTCARRRAAVQQLAGRRRRRLGQQRVESFGVLQQRGAAQHGRSGPGVVVERRSPCLAVFPARHFARTTGTRPLGLDRVLGVRIVV